MKTNFGFTFYALMIALGSVACGQSGSSNSAQTPVINPLGYNGATSNFVSFSIESRAIEQPYNERINVGDLAERGAGKDHDQDHESSNRRPNERGSEKDHRQIRPDENIHVSASPLSIRRAFSVANQGYISCMVTNYGSLHITAGNQTARATETISLDMLNFPFGNYSATTARATGPDAFQGRVINQLTETDFLAGPASSCDYRMAYVAKGAAGHLSASFRCSGMTAVNRPAEMATSEGKFDCNITTP